MKEKNTMSNTTGIVAGVICLLLMLGMLPTSIATASSSKVIIPTPKARAVFTGHSFATGGGVRVYLFDLFVDKSSREVATNESRFKTKISWSGANHTLTVHNEYKDNIFGHQKIDVKYQCDYDPFLDLTAKCRYISHTPYKEYDTLYPEGRDDNVYYFNPLGLFDPTADGSIHLSVYREVISPARNKQLIWEALAKSMKTSIFAGGTEASSQADQVFTTAEEIVFKVESARDIKRITDQPVSFYIVPRYGLKVVDINFNTIAMPIMRKYSGNSYNEAVCTLKLMPGKYTFYTSMLSSMTSKVESKKISFEVKSHIDPHKAPVIVSPRNRQRFAGEEAVPIKVLVPGKFFKKAFAAEVEVEHSRLAAQTPYKYWAKYSLKPNNFNDSIVGKQIVFAETGDFRIRARMVYDGKSTGTWSEWRNFHTGGKVMPHLKPGMVISSPVEKNFYTGDIPVTIKLPQFKPGSSLRLTLGFLEDAVFNSNNPSQAQHFPFSIKSEEFNLKDGQTTFTTKYSRKQLIAAIKNKPGQFQLLAELLIPGAGKQERIRKFHIAQLGNAARNGQQKKSGNLNLNLPGNNGLGTHGVSVKNHQTNSNPLDHVSLTKGKQSTGSKFKPIANPNEFKIILPKSGETYRNKFLVDISVPPSLHDNPTITLEIICRPLKKGLLKKRDYTPKTTLLTMPLYSRYKDRVLTTILARNIHSKVFHGINRFSSSEFKIRAIIHAGKISLSQTSAWFRILYDERTYRQENSVLSLAPGIALESKLKIFKAPTTVKIRVGNIWNAEINCQIQYNDCQFRNKYRTISLKPKIVTKDETTKILNFFIKKAGCYRVRAQNRKTGASATWSAWCKFTVQASLPRVSKSPSIKKLNASGKKVATLPSSPTQKLEGKGRTTSQQFKLNKISPKAINPQPEPPGRPTSRQFKLNKISPKAINPQPEPPGRPAVLSSGKSKTKSVKSVHPVLPIKNPVVTIQTPRERYKYMMTGKSVHIVTKISNPTKARLQIQLQEKKKNHFVDIHPRINQRYTRGQTIADFTLNQRGEYRFRVKAVAKNSKFGPWRTFLIDAIKHSVMPKVAPAKPTAPKTSRPVTTLHPVLQHIR